MAVATALTLGLPAAPLRAQSTPVANTAATPAPAASPAPAATPAATAPATPSASASPDKITASGSSAPKPGKRTRMTARQQVEHALKTGTVPARYRSQVPKQYQRYIPFEK